MDSLSMRPVTLNEFDVSAVHVDFVVCVIKRLPACHQVPVRMQRPSRRRELFFHIVLMILKRARLPGSLGPSLSAAASPACRRSPSAAARTGPWRLRAGLCDRATSLSPSSRWCRAGHCREPKSDCARRPSPLLSDDDANRAVTSLASLHNLIASSRSTGSYWAGL